MSAPARMFILPGVGLKLEQARQGLKAPWLPWRARGGISLAWGWNGLKLQATVARTGVR